MSTDTDRAKLTVEELTARFRGELIPLTGKFSYFATLPVAEEDLRQYLNDPIAAISPAIVAALPHVGLLLAPYLEKGNGKGVDTITFERPAENRYLAVARRDLDKNLTMLALGIKEVEVADYHYQLYSALAAIVAERWSPDVQERFFRTIREELSADVHGEVDERSWHLKQALQRRQTNVRKETKLFREYARQAFEDTLTLYLHGTCCDIDVETGPRQMPSRYLRRRLELLVSLFPPPEGYAVLPEQLKSALTPSSRSEAAAVTSLFTEPRTESLTEPRTRVSLREPGIRTIRDRKGAEPLFARIDQGSQKLTTAKSRQNSPRHLLPPLAHLADRTHAGRAPRLAPARREQLRRLLQQPRRHPIQRRALPDAAG